MTCDEFKRALEAFFMQTLHPDAAAGVQAHAASCPDCEDVMKCFAELCCRDCTETLIHYVEGDLPPERRTVLERHLVVCIHCTNYLQSYRETIRISVTVLSEFRDPTPRELPDELVLAILAAAPRSGKNPS